MHAVASLIEAEGVSKAFPGVVALDRVSFDLRSGEVHFLLGENGAGKSTLINILSGVVQPDSGTVRLEGREVVFPTPHHAQSAGIRTIHQEFYLIGNLSVAENIVIESPPRLAGPVISWKKMKGRARGILEQLRVDIDLKRKVRDLPAAEKQIVDIARALAERARVLIMDEPTSALSAGEIATLFQTIERLKSEGIGIIYISHRLEELSEIADRVSVLRDGRNQGTYPVDESLDEDSLVETMVGRRVQEQYPRQRAAAGPAALETRNLTLQNVYSEVSVCLRRGEIVGVTGVVGSGMEPLAYSLAGVLEPDGGSIEVNGRRVKLSSVGEAIRHGIGLIPGDRREMGLIVDFPVDHNITLASLHRLGRAGWIATAAERDLCGEYVRLLGIVLPALTAPTGNLSGGNQQKVVIAKWLARNVNALICVEPTRGIDVGARAEIYRIFNQMTAEGKSVLLFSTDYSEILGMSDRIYVIRNGTVVDHYRASEAQREVLLKSVFGSSSVPAGA